MTILVLNRRRILDRIPGWISDSARSVVVLTASSALSGVDLAWLRRRLRHLEIAVDYASPQTEHRIDELCTTYRVDRILTTSEGDIIRSAQARRRHRLEGTSIESALAYRDKLVMKTAAAAAGVPVAAMAAVSDGDEVAAFAAEHGYPVVLKQRSGQASAGMTLVNGRADAARLDPIWEQLSGGRPMLAEQWLDGALYHVDGLMDAGRMLRSWPSRYLTPNWEVVRSAEPCVSGMLHPSDPVFDRLRETTARTVAALPPPVGLHAFHAEFFAGPDGSVTLGEIAARAGGGRIVDTWERAFGTNLYGAALQDQAGGTADLGRDQPTSRLGWAMFPPRTGRLTRVPPGCPLPSVVEYRVTAPVGSVHRHPRHSAEQIGDAVLRLSGRDTVAELATVRDWWQGAVGWAAG